MRAIAGSAAAILESVRELDPEMRVFVSASGVDLRRRAGEPAAGGHAVPAHHALRDRQARRASAGRARMRAHDGLHASSGIVFNHESERRPERFVTRRITRGAAAIALGLSRS